MKLGIYIVGSLLAFSVAEARQVYGEYLVKFRNQEARAVVESSLERMGARIERSYSLVPGLTKVVIKSEGETAQVVTKLLQISDVEYVTPNYLRKIEMNGQAQRQEFRADPALPGVVAPPTTWIDDPKTFSQFGLTQNRTRDVWNKYKFIGDAKTVIAVIDTGVDYTHQDLVANMWRNPGESGKDSSGRDKEANGVDDDGNGYVDDVVGYDFVNKDSLPYDDHSHGTHVAGISAATGGNGFGISGQCSRCSVMGLKFISADGWGSDADAIAALEYAVKNGAQIANCSWGGTEESPALFDAFKSVSQQGLLVSVAAGNDGEDIGFRPHYPARYELPGLVSVAALYGVNIMIPWWSNFSGWFVHVSSGGVDVYSSVPGGKFANYSGTSMAAPQVAGLLGMMKAYRPALRAADAVDLLKNVIPDRDSMEKTNFAGRPDLLTIFDKLSTSKN